MKTNGSLMINKSQTFPFVVIEIPHICGLFLLLTLKYVKHVAISMCCHRNPLKYVTISVILSLKSLKFVAIFICCHWTSYYIQCLNCRCHWNSSPLIVAIWNLCLKYWSRKEINQATNIRLQVTVNNLLLVGQRRFKHPHRKVYIIISLTSIIWHDCYKLQNYEDTDRCLRCWWGRGTCLEKMNILFSLFTLFW